METLSRENLSRLIQELDEKQVCVMCENSVAKYANRSLCLLCWQDCEGENPEYE